MGRLLMGRSGASDGLDPGLVVAGLSVAAVLLAVAADSVMDDVQAEPAAAVLALGDRLTEGCDRQLMVDKDPGLVAAARGPAAER